MTENHEKLESLLDRLLFFAMDDRFREEVDLAQKVFEKASGPDNVYGSLFGFNEWLIHDYLLQNGESFMELFQKEQSEPEDAFLIDALRGSRLSIYEVVPSDQGPFMKDLITRVDYATENHDVFETLNESALHLMRLYPFHNRWIALPQGVEFEPSLSDVLRKGVMSQYSDYCSAQGPAELETFVYENPLLIYKMSEIVEDIEVQADYDDEDYVVFQSIYLFADIQGVRNALDTLPETELAIDEEGVSIYRMYTDATQEQQLAEMVVSGNRLELECLTPADQKESRKRLEAYLGDRITHFKDERMDMDELLEGDSE